jgi:ribosomal-protein-alanine N-acetyltransferase
MLREAGHADLAAVHALDRSCSPVFTRAAAYAQLLSGDGLLLIAATEAGIQGFGAWSRVLDEASLLNLVVSPLARREGLARALLSAGRERLAAAGVQRVLLEVRESNTAALRLYTHAGFERDALRRDYYAAGDSGKREAAILMSQQLEKRHACS